MKIRGFTLFELLTCTSLFSVIAGVGFPSLYASLQYKRVQLASAQIHQALGEARGAAIEQHAYTVICPSLDGLICNRDGRWEEGILVFVDADGDRQMSASEAMVQYFPALKSGTSVRLEHQQALFYSPKGTLSSSAHFNVCIDRDSNSGRAISVTRAGRPRTDPQAMSCDHHS